MEKQISLPPNIYIIYNFFNKTKNKDWDKNPFVFYKNINNINIKIAENISNLNFYQIDIPVYKNIKPEYIIKYLKDLNYRNYYANNTLFYKLISKKNNNEWIENEYCNNIENCFNVIMSPFLILFYNDIRNFNQNVADAKFYQCYKILNDVDNDKYILRFEIVLNNMDFDQDNDIIIYLNMLIRLIKDVYKKFKINCKYKLIRNKK